MGQVKTARRTRLALAGTVAALAATVLLLGGALPRTDLPAAAVPATPVRADPAAATKAGVRSLQTQVRADRRDARSLTLLALAYQQRARETGDAAYLTRSERSLRAALRVAPRDADAVTALGALALSRHEFGRALVLGHRALALRPRDPNAYGVVGDALLELGRYNAAFAAFDAMAARRPNASSYARISYGRELLGRTSGALSAMRLAVDAASDPESAAWTRVELGNLYAGSGRLALAERQYRDALQRYPMFAPALDALADAASDRRRFRLAARLYAAALARASVADYAVGLGDALAALGRRAEAEAAYRRAHGLEERFAAHGGRNELDLALFELDHDRNLGGALARARVGHRLRPSLEGEHVLAWALYKNGRCTEARRYSVRALRLGTKDLDAIYHRSLIERCLGNHRAAAAFRERVRALNRFYLLAPPSSSRVGDR